MSLALLLLVLMQERLIHGLKKKFFFLENAKESRYYIAYLLAITCGMRKGEILGLQWKDIDFERRTLSVNRSSHITKEFHEPKTSSGKRLIVLPEITLLALQEHLLKINEEKARYGDGYNNFDLVCPTYNGNPCNFRSLTQLWKKLIKKCGFLIFVSRSTAYPCNINVETGYSPENRK